MEVQITDFENAAFAVFVVLLSRAILSFGLNFYIPIGRVGENFGRGMRRGAVSGEKFWFRKWVWPGGGVPALGHANGHDHSHGHVNGNGHANGHGHPRTPTDRSPPRSAEQSRCPSPGVPELGPVEDEYEEMTMNEIINGKVSLDLLFSRSTSRHLHLHPASSVSDRLAC